jgi:hypothetical protein
MRPPGARDQVDRAVGTREARRRRVKLRGAQTANGLGALRLGQPGAAAAWLGRAARGGCVPGGENCPKNRAEPATPGGNVSGGRRLFPDRAGARTPEWPLTSAG